MSRLEKLLRKILREPTPNDTTYEEAAKLLLSIGCLMRKRTGTRHRQFSYPGFRSVVTLLADERVKAYQIEQIKELLLFVGIIEEE